MRYGTWITYRSKAPSSASGRTWAAAHCFLERPGLVGCSSSGSQGCPGVPECWHWSSETVLESMLSAWHPGPRSDASAASRLRRLAGRVSCQLRAWPGTGAGAERRLNGLQSLQADCREAAVRVAREQRCWEGRCCGGAVETSRTCTPILFHC